MPTKTLNLDSTPKISTLLSILFFCAAAVTAQPGPPPAPPSASDCECPDGHWYDSNRESCVTTACESVPGMPDGDKGGGYFAWDGHLFIDVEGAECPDGLDVTAEPKVSFGCDRYGSTTTEVNLQITGGVGPYTCQGPASNLPIVAIGSSCLAQGIAFGKHVFTVIDSKGQTADVEVDLKDVVELQAGAVKPPSCCSCADGSATVLASGDHQPFRYRWYPQNHDSETATGLKAGTHRVTVTDQGGCYRDIEITVPQAADCPQGPDVGDPAAPDGSIGSIWRLGQLQIGKSYETSVTAQNINCKGKHNFEVTVEGAPWFKVTGPTVLRKIRPGQSSATEAAVDLRGIEPGEYRGRLMVRCLTCPAKCTQSQTVFQVEVSATE